MTAPTVESNSRRLAKNAGWSLLGFVVPSVVMLVTVPVYIWFLGVRDYGLFALANSLVGLAGILNLGLGHATTKFVAEYTANGEGGALRAMVYATLAFYSITGVIGWVVLWAVAGPLAEHALDLSGAEAVRAARVLKIVAAGFIPTVAFTVAAGLFNGLQQYRASQLLTMGRSVLSLVVGVAVLALGTGLEGLAIGIVCVLWFSCGAGFVIGMRRLPPSDGQTRLSRSLLKRVLGFSFYTSLTSIGTLAVGQLDKVLVGSLLGLEAVSVYAVGQSAALKINVFNTSVARVLMPFFSARSVDEDASKKMRGVFVAAWRSSLVIGGAITTFALATAPWALEVWLDDSFATLVLPVFVVFVVTYGLNTINVVPYFYLLGRDRPSLITWPALVGGAIMIGGVAVFSPIAGLFGAALASVAYPVICIHFSVGATKITPGYTSATGARAGSLGFIISCVVAGLAGFVVGNALEGLLGSPIISLFGSGGTTAILLAALAALGVRRKNPFFDTVLSIARRLRSR